MKTIAIIQSNYIPWKGYFDIIDTVDEFIFYDTAIYTPRTWRNRNIIKTAQGPQWLIIPVHHDHENPARICDTLTVDNHWRKKHWKNLMQHYASAPCFKHCADQIKSLYLAHEERSLSDINFRFIIAINQLLGITTPLTRLTDYALSGDKDHDLITLCKRANASRYLSGPIARTFLNQNIFRDAGIEIEWADYSGYPPYPQLHPPFTHEVSILDLLFNTGPAARSYLKKAA